VYRCAGCGAELFAADTKFESGSGWPSFTEPAVAEAVEAKQDVSHGMISTEVICKRCGGHLGHVFDDGPRDAGGLRYCINSAALELDSNTPR
jgi:peptide-methionine (R)-S-oxide reductase